MTLPAQRSIKLVKQDYKKIFEKKSRKKMGMGMGIING